MREVKIGLLGCGTVGGGFVRLLEHNRTEIARRQGIELSISRILVRDTEKERAGVATRLLTRDVDDVIGNGCHIVVELIGGDDPARGFLRDAITRRKHVVTANKSLLASSGNDLFDLAETHRVRIGFEASVGGAIPIVRVIRDSLEGDRVRSIRGVLNGTTNFVLSRMAAGADFDEAVRLAQQCGFAERDPTRDLNGSDSAEKLIILSRLAWPGTRLRWKRRQGIQAISPDEIARARCYGKVVRLVAQAAREGEEVVLSVAPEQVDASDPLASVTAELNGVVLQCEAAGTLTFYGKGAGSLPSAASVLADVVELARG
jgi:homoserine dehydrogenase